MQESISLQDIIKIFRKRLWLIFFLIVISIGISIGITYYAITPIYQAQTQILVNQNTSSDEVYSWQTTEIDLRLINTYNAIITSPVILTPVIEKLKLNLTLAQLTQKITISSQDDSKVVNLSVVDSDPSKAVEISNTIAEVFKEQIPQLMSVDNISVLSEAKLSDEPIPVKPNEILNIIIGGLIGLMLGIVIAFLLELFDYTVKNESDVETLLNLPVIGIVDVIADEKKKRFSLTSRKARRA